jgi:NAD(P)-dependent dehydrogenase (short-subunit alcohol dehydrogenase family)
MAYPFDLSGRVAVVTGGNSGIGAGIVGGLARAGADVSIWGRDDARSAAVADELSEHGHRALAVHCDVTDPASVDAAFSQTLSELGRIDACFANAGGTKLAAPFVEMTLEDFRRATALNLDGAFLTFQGAARHMIERGAGGSLIGVSSLAASDGMPRGQHYAASKAGIAALVRSCAVELARYGIRANTIVPGWVVTPATVDALAHESLRTGVLSRVPLGRWGRPADLAGVAVYLASAASEYHTGDVLTVDGGYDSY